MMFMTLESPQDKHNSRPAAKSELFAAIVGFNGIILARWTAKVKEIDAFREALAQTEEIVPEHKNRK
jgi:hypothetical protein